MEPNHSPPMLTARETRVKMAPRRRLMSDASGKMSWARRGFLNNTHTTTTEKTSILLPKTPMVTTTHRKLYWYKILVTSRLSTKQETEIGRLFDQTFLTSLLVEIKHKQKKLGAAIFLQIHCLLLSESKKNCQKSYCFWNMTRWKI